MPIRAAFSAILWASLCSHAQAQEQFAWPDGKHAAVALTYDDSLQSQLAIAVPQLNAAGFKGTFFLGANPTPPDMLRWREAQRAGHELGNHSAFHPCPRAILPDRPQYFTENYNVGRMLGEIGVMNLVLFGIDGAATRTYSAPCSQMMVGGVDYTDELRRSGLVKYVRTGGDAYKSVIADPRSLDLFGVPSWGFLDKPDGPTLIAFAERVHAAKGLGVYQFHGVGGDYLEVTAKAHQQLLTWLREHPDIWVGTFQEVMDYVGTHAR